MEFTNYIESELFIIVPVLYILGMLIKKSEVKNKYIPIILGVMGVFLVSVYKLTIYIPNTLTDYFKILFSGITQGLLCAAASVYTNNLIKQLKKDKDSNDKTVVEDNQSTG